MHKIKNKFNIGSFYHIAGDKAETIPSIIIRYNHKDYVLKQEDDNIVVVSCDGLQDFEIIANNILNDIFKADTMKIVENGAYVYKGLDIRHPEIDDKNVYIGILKTNKGKFSSLLTSFDTMDMSDIPVVETPPRKQIDLTSPVNTSQLDKDKAILEKSNENMRAKLLSKRVFKYDEIKSLEKRINSVKDNIKSLDREIAQLEIVRNGIIYSLSSNVLDTLRVPDEVNDFLLARFKRQPKRYEDLIEILREKMYILRLADYSIKEIDIMPYMQGLSPESEYIEQMQFLIDYGFQFNPDGYLYIVTDEKWNVIRDHIEAGGFITNVQFDQESQEKNQALFE